MGRRSVSAGGSRSGSAGLRWVAMQLEAALLQAALHPRDRFGMMGDATILPARWGEHAQGQQPQPLAVQYQ